jgi:eukaryotic-like serine/threonine-protein kinase
MAADKMARVQTNAEIHATRVTSEPLAELPRPPPSRRGYGAGDLIDGKYQLEGLIGSGGMGEVWTARNDTLGVRRAVKLIRADSDSAESTDRLLHEAQAAARLADAAIVRVFDFGKTERGDPYIVMEMLEGEDLMSIINRRERLSPTKAVRVLLPVIRALAAAHGHGIVHRDLKPENIFLARTPDGRVQPKLLDFGIAKLKNARELRLTSAGSVMGSPLYMAPEQARGEDVDERADIWALSVVLYEAMTGQTPFGGDDRAQVMHAVATLDPEHPHRRGVEDPVPWAILQRGLQKARGDRWSSMQELGRELARWLLDGGVSDDITGASLEAGWFRNSRRSLFASSLPPERTLGRGLNAATRLLSEAIQRTKQCGVWLSTRSEKPLAWFARLERKRRIAIVVGLLASSVLALGVLFSGAPEPPPAAVAAAVVPPPSPAQAAPPPPAVAPAPPALSAPAAPSAEPEPEPEPVAAPAPSATPSRATSTRAPARKTKRASARKSPRTTGTTREPATGARRAKLIDPYQ